VLRTTSCLRIPQQKICEWKRYWFVSNKDDGKEIYAAMRIRCEACVWCVSGSRENQIIPPSLSMWRESILAIVWSHDSCLNLPTYPPLPTIHRDIWETKAFPCPYMSPYGKGNLYGALTQEYSFQQCFAEHEPELILVVEPELSHDATPASKLTVF
jgi:hypothetical protein